MQGFSLLYNVLGSRTLLHFSILYKRFASSYSPGFSGVLRLVNPLLIILTVLFQTFSFSVRSNSHAMREAADEALARALAQAQRQSVVHSIALNSSDAWHDLACGTVLLFDRPALVWIWTWIWLKRLSSTLICYQWIQWLAFFESPSFLRADCVRDWQGPQLEMPESQVLLKLPSAVTVAGRAHHFVRFHMCHNHDFIFVLFQVLKIPCPKFNLSLQRTISVHCSVALCPFARWTCRCDGRHDLSWRGVLLHVLPGGEAEQNRPFQALCLLCPTRQAGQEKTEASNTWHQLTPAQQSQSYAESCPVLPCMSLHFHALHFPCSAARKPPRRLVGFAALFSFTLHCPLTQFLVGRLWCFHQCTNIPLEVLWLLRCDFFGRANAADTANAMLGSKSFLFAAKSNFNLCHGSCAAAAGPFGLGHADRAQWVPERFCVDAEVAHEAPFSCQPHHLATHPECVEGSLSGAEEAGWRRLWGCLPDEGHLCRQLVFQSSWDLRFGEVGDQTRWELRKRGQNAEDTLFRVCGVYTRHSWYGQELWRRVGDDALSQWRQFEGLAFEMQRQWPLHLSKTHLLLWGRWSALVVLGSSAWPQPTIHSGPLWWSLGGSGGNSPARFGTHGHEARQHHAAMYWHGI